MNWNIYEDIVDELLIILEVMKKDKDIKPDVAVTIADLMCNVSKYDSKDEASSRLADRFDNFLENLN